MQGRGCRKPWEGRTSLGLAQPGSKADGMPGSGNQAEKTRTENAPGELPGLAGTMAFPCPCRPGASAWWLCWGHGGAAGPANRGELPLVAVKERVRVAGGFMGWQARGKRAHRPGPSFPAASPVSSAEGAARESSPGAQRLTQWPAQPREYRVLWLWDLWHRLVLVFWARWRGVVC